MEQSELLGILRRAFVCVLCRLVSCTMPNKHKKETTMERCVSVTTEKRYKLEQNYFLTWAIFRRRNSASQLWNEILAGMLDATQSIPWFQRHLDRLDALDNFNIGRTCCTCEYPRLLTYARTNRWHEQVWPYEAVEVLRMVTSPRTEIKTSCRLPTELYVWYC